MKKTSKQAKTTSHESGRSRISQQDVPGISLSKALRVPQAIGQEYGYKPVTPVQLAKALDMQTTSGPFRMITGASIAYGLTKGGAFADIISLEPLGLSAVRPTNEGDDALAERQALLRPRVIREFLTRYNGAAIPREEIALNVLNDLGVPPERAKSVFDLIIEGAGAVGILQDIKGRIYVELGGAELTLTEEPEDTEEQLESTPSRPTPPYVQKASLEKPPVPPAGIDDKRTRRVFITHGKNMAFVEPIKKLLAFGELEPVVSVERQSVSQPVPDKVLGDMRSCGASIIHVDEELRLIDKEMSEHVVLNPNVLIEIGASMALYGRRFILLVRDGIELPSNLKGLYEVRYSGENLDSNATIKLLEAIRDIKNHPAPSTGA
jgi:predicted nucleotide-binding protein